jgi:hypothetical protein
MPNTNEIKRYGKDSVRLMNRLTARVLMCTAWSARNFAMIDMLCHS